MKRWCLAALLAGVIGCGAAPVPKPSVLGSLANGAHPALPKPRAGDATKDERDVEALQGLIDETYTVITSRAFLNNLLQLDDVGDLWLSPYGDTIAPKQVAVLYLGLDPAHRAPPATLNVGGESGRTVAETKLGADHASIEMGRWALDRWRSSEVVHKSCAVNALAHELTHTVPRVPGHFLFIDGGRARATRGGLPLVSYTVGAVAQCTYLSLRGVTAQGNMLDCVKKWGANLMHTQDCGDS